MSTAVPPSIPLTELVIHVIADSTGDTGARVARAVEAQFPELEHVTVVRHPRLMTQDSMTHALSAVAADAGRQDCATVVFLTMVDISLRDQALRACQAMEVPCIDVMAPVLDAVAQHTGARPARKVQPVGLAADYFERIHAMEFAIANDDGSLHDSLDEAAIVLVGASRTGKTPLSMYLGYLGYPTANVPLVTGVAPPPELFACDPWKVVGLTIDPERLLTIRQRRVETMGVTSTPPATGLGTGLGTGAGAGLRTSSLGGYADLAGIFDELDAVAKVHKRLGCPVIDTTSLALEEAAGRVIDVVSARKRAYGKSHTTS